MSVLLKVAMTALAAAALAAVLLLALWPFLRHQLMYPGGRMRADQADPKLWGLPTAEEVRIETADGVTLHGWWIPAAGPRADARGAVIYFHGNASTIGPRAWLGGRLARRGVHVLLFDYRGYGLSDGRPGEAGLRRDARAAWDHVVEARGVPPERIVLMGNSLGSAVATDLALDRHDAAALILSAPFPDFPALFRHHAPWLPLRLLPWRSNRWEAGSRVGALAMPVLIALGELDRVVPPHLSRAVYDAASEPRRLVVTDAEHNTLVAEPAFWHAIDEQLDDALGR
ncbi:MAG: alpha/beta hydrolase [Gemmatimonadota bacterium]